MMSHNTLWGMLHILGLVAGLWMILGRSPLEAFISRPLWRSIVLSGGMCLYLAWVSEPPNAFEDFIDAYYAAGEAVLNDGPEGLIRVIEMGVSGFVNLPVVAYLFAPFALIGARAAAILFMLAGIVSALLAWRLLARMARLDERQSAALLFLFAANGPLYNSLKEGNTSHFILLAFVLALTWASARRELAAGVVLGVAAVIKPPLLLTGVYFLLRRRWGVVIGGGVTCTAVAVLSLAVFGLEFHRLWYELSIAPFSRDPMAAFNVQSLQAFWLRFQLGIDGLFLWSPLALVPPYSVLSRLSVIAVGILAAFALLWKPRHTETRTRPADLLAIEFSLVVSVICAISPVSWSHYYTWYLLPIALFLSRSAPAWNGPAVRLSGWMAIALLSVPVVAVPYAPGWLRMPYMQIATSGLLLGGLMCLLMLVWIRVRIVAHDRNAG